MKLEIYNINGQSTGRSVDLPAEVFGIEPNEHVVWLDVKRYLAAQRQGTHKAKERGEIKGSTRKLHRQKGTGGSRKGSIKNPLFKGGGRIFGPRPRKYDIKLNQKVKELARRSALSAKAKDGAIVVVEDFTFDAPKTKAFTSVLNALNLADKKTLTVLPDYDKTLYMSARNIQGADIAPASDLNTYRIMRANTMVISESAVEKLKTICE